MNTQAITYKEMDKLRKCCLAAICKYIDIREISTFDKIGYAKNMACWASNRDEFNRIVPSELRGITAYFNKESRAIENSQKEALRQSSLFDINIIPAAMA